MSSSLDAYIAALVESGLMTEEEVRAFLETWSGGPPPADGSELGQALIEAGMLTLYQAKEVSQGSGRPLVVGNYIIVDKLGQGGMGVVYKAKHRRMDRIVALKVLSPKFVDSPEMLRRFHREVKAVAKLSHPNVVAAFDADEVNGTHFLVMEYAEGTNLSALVKRCGPLSPERAIDCILQAARGLDFAHGKGVIHRDIKPSNLILGVDGTVRILDLGLARIESTDLEQTALTSSEMMMGTVDYMSPEQALDTRQADERSDIYSLGCTLFYLATGQTVYDGDTAMKRLLAHRDRPVPSLDLMADDLPDSVDAVFQRMMAKRPGDRYQTVAELLEDLHECVELTDGSTTHMDNSSKLSGTDSSLREMRAALRSSTEGEFGSPDLAAGGATVVEVAKASRRSAMPSSAESKLEPRFETLSKQRRRHGRGWKKVLIAVAGVAVVGFLGLGLWPDNGTDSGDRVPSPPPERVDHALFFHGNGDRVEIPKLDVDGASAITIEAVFRPYLFDPAGGDFSECDPVAFGPLRVRLLADGNWQVVVDGVPVLNATTWTKPGQRTQVAVVWNGKTISLFVDGERQGDPVPIDPLDWDKPSYWIGGPDDGEPSHRGEDKEPSYRGEIDEVRISRIARYEEEAYEPTPHLQADDDTLALYHFDDAAGTTLKDAIDEAHDGVIHGAATWVLAYPGLEINHDRAIAERVAAMGGLLVCESASGEQFDQKELADRLYERFHIITLNAGLSSNADLNDLTADQLSDLPELKKLRVLSLQENKNVAGSEPEILDHVAKVESLEQLVLSFTPVDCSSLRALEGHANLRYLSVLVTPAATDDELPELAEFRKKMGSCFVAATYDERGAAKFLMEDMAPVVVEYGQDGQRLRVTNFADLPRQSLRLIEVDMSQSLSYHKSLWRNSKFPYLERVNLSNQSGATDDMAEHLTKFKSLKELILRGTGITDAGIATLSSALLGCTITKPDGTVLKPDAE